MLAHDEAVSVCIEQKIVYVQILLGIEGGIVRDGLFCALDTRSGYQLPDVLESPGAIGCFAPVIQGGVGYTLQSLLLLLVGGYMRR